MDPKNKRNMARCIVETLRLTIHSLDKMFSDSIEEKQYHFDDKHRSIYVHIYIYTSFS